MITSLKIVKNLPTTSRKLYIHIGPMVCEILNYTQIKHPVTFVLGLRDVDLCLLYLTGILLKLRCLTDIYWYVMLDYIIMLYLD